MITLVSVVYRLHYRLDKGKSYKCKSKTGNRCSVENNSGQWVDVPCCWFRKDLTSKEIDEILSDAFVKSGDF